MKPKKHKPPKYDNLKAAMGSFASTLRTREEIKADPENKGAPYYTSTWDAVRKGIIKE